MMTCCLCCVSLILRRPHAQHFSHTAQLPFMLSTWGSRLMVRLPVRLT